MKKIDNNDLSFLKETIAYDNAVLFLGQKYAEAIQEENNIFSRKINIELCNGCAKEDNYRDLWAYLIDNQKSCEKRNLNTEQIDRIRLIDDTIIPSNRLKNLMELGWASIITSSIESIFFRVDVDCDPIFNVLKCPVGLGNKKRLHISYLYGCIREGNIPMVKRPSITENENAKKMCGRVIDASIRYSGALVIDGWDPATDWMNAKNLLCMSALDPVMPEPRVYIFGCPSKYIDILRENEELEELMDSDKLLISDKSFYESLGDYIDVQIKAKEDTFRNAEDYTSVMFKRKGHDYEIKIPNRVLYTLDRDTFHIITPQDRRKLALTKETVRDITINFLENSGEGFPYWQAYLQGCCFERDVYKNKNHTGLYDMAERALRAENLHKVKSTIIIHGPSNSGKSIILGKLAMELSEEYPVIYIKGNMRKAEPELSERYYPSLINFINEYITRSSQELRTKAVVIWDGGFYIDRVRDYAILAEELEESNVVLIASAYEIRDFDLVSDNRNRMMFIHMDSKLSQNEKDSMRDMLNYTLGNGFGNIYKRIKSASPYESLNEDEDLILTLLQRAFKGIRRNSIVLEAKDRTFRETQTVEGFFSQNVLQQIFNKTEQEFLRHRMGLDAILEDLKKKEFDGEIWYEELKNSVVTLNDIIALAGQFGIDLSLDLVKDVLCSIHSGIKPYLQMVDRMLQLDTMMKNPFPVGENGEKLVGYRSPIEAGIYLDKRYNSREGKNIENSVRIDMDGKPYLEDRELDLLEKIIENGKLEDCSSLNISNCIIIHDLVEQFGSHSRKNNGTDNNFSRRFEYRHAELADFIMNHGGGENPEMALMASFLMRERIQKQMFQQINNHKNILPDQKKILDLAMEGLERAMSIEESAPRGSESSRMMRLLFEWCTNRNYTFNIENPDICDEELFYQIKKKFFRGLKIYLGQKENRRSRHDILDVYLNAFHNYIIIMEKMNKTDEDEFCKVVSDTMNHVLRHLLRVEEIKDSKKNLNENVLLVYQYARQSAFKLKEKTRAQGSSAFILLSARMLWLTDQTETNILGVNSIRSINSYDIYTLQDYADKEGVTQDVLMAARRVYCYLKEPSNLSVLLGRKNRNEQKEVEGIAMLIRAAWISKTECMPFTLDQCPALTKEDWDELHTYCKAYTESGNVGANYAFAYYLEGIYNWIFRDEKNSLNGSLSRSEECFAKCRSRKMIKSPKISDKESFFYLCLPESREPVKFKARVKKETMNRWTAELMEILNCEKKDDFLGVFRHKDIYAARTLFRIIPEGVYSTQTVTIRFNLEGALCGPEMSHDLKGGCTLG